MEQIIFTIILFLIYVYIFEGVATSFLPQDNKSENFPTTVATTPVVSPQEFPDKINDLRYSQMVELLCKKHFNALPKKRSRKSLKAVLVTYAHNHPEMFQAKLEELNYA